jgi:hypothetical protein
MKKPLGILIAAFLVVAAFAPLAFAENLKFRGGIGVDPVTGGGARNDVRTVQPGGAPWVIRELKADVKQMTMMTDTRIMVDGTGLLLAGTDNIGTPGGQSVFATLICEITPANPNTTPPTPAVFSFHSTPHGPGKGVALEPDGDFRINDVLDNLPLEDPCKNPVLLIRSNGNQRWFAAGIPSHPGN